MIVDIRKLDEHRDAIDDSVTELALAKDCCRAVARSDLATSLGFIFERTHDGMWCIAGARSFSDMDRAMRVYCHKGTDCAIAFEARSLSGLSAIAFSMEDAEMAVLCMILDPEVDLQAAIQTSHQWEKHQMPEVAHVWNEHCMYSWDEFDTYVGPHEWRQMNKPGNVA